MFVFIENYMEKKIQDHAIVFTQYDILNFFLCY